MVDYCMTHKNTVRPAMTAIAAAIALSSAPLFAQSTDVPVDPTATPVVESTPAPVTADPLAPAATTVAVEPVVTKTTSTPRKATATKSTAPARTAPARVSPPARAAAAAPAAAIVAPIPQAPVAQPLPPPTEIAADPIAEPADATSVDLLRTAGLGLLGLLILAAGWLAFRSRRRRRAQEAEDAEWQQQAEAEPAMADPEPAMTVEPQPEPAMTAEPVPVLVATSSVAAAVAAAAPEQTPESEAKFIGPVADLPENFDLSRFGPNMQDAYRGPTEDNPSASLKTRLSRASGMDQQERKLDAEVEAATGESVLDESPAAPPAEAPAAKPPVVRHVHGDFILGSDGEKKKPAPTLTN